MKNLINELKYKKRNKTHDKKGITRAKSDENSEPCHIYSAHRTHIFFTHWRHIGL